MKNVKYSGLNWKEKIKLQFKYNCTNATVLLSMLVSFHLPFLVQFPFSVQSLIYTPISLIFTQNALATIFPRVELRAWCVNEGLSGVAWLVWRYSWPCAQNYASTKFNVPTWVPMLASSPAPCPVGDWADVHCRLYISMILQIWLWFYRLSSPACVKCVCTFFCHDLT